MLSSVWSQAKDTSGRQVAIERQGTSQALELGRVGSRVHARPSRWHRPKGDEAAELWPCSPGSSPIVRQRQKGGEWGAGYLSTMRSRCRFFCLSWLFLPACNLRLVWPPSSWVLKDPIRTKEHSYQLGSNRSGQALWPVAASSATYSRGAILRAVASARPLALSR